MFCPSRVAEKTISSCSNSYENNHTVAAYYSHFRVSLSQTGCHGNTLIFETVNIKH